MDTPGQEEPLSDRLARFPERTRAVLRYLYGLEDACPHTLQETGDHFGISKQRVHQIREAAKAKAAEWSAAARGERG